MALDSELLVLCGYTFEDAPEELKQFTGLLGVMLGKIAGLNPAFRFLQASDPMQTLSGIKADDTILVFMYPALAEESMFTILFTGIMDKVLAGAAGAREGGQLVLFTEGDASKHSRLIPDYLPGVKMRYNLSLLQGAGTAGEGRIFDCLLDIAYGMKNHREKRTEALQEKSRPVIYLAETTPDAVAQRDSLKNELEILGYRVATPVNTTEKEEQVTAHIRELISRSFLSLHMIGRLYGYIPDGWGKSLVELQLQLAGEEDIKKPAGAVKRMIWIMPPGKKSDPRQEKLISRIKQESHMFMNSEMLETPFESLKTYLHRYLAMRPQDMIAETGKADESDGLFVIYETGNPESLQPLTSWLQKENIGYSLPLAAEAPEETMPHYRRMLASAKSVLVFHTGGNDIWLRTKINDILKAPGYGRKLPFHSRILLVREGTKLYPGEQFYLVSYAGPNLGNEVLDKLKSILHHA